MFRILFVENERITSVELGSFLEDEGIEVESVHSGGVALGAIDRLPPRLLVTNLQIGPGPSGLDVARYARALRPDIRIVLVSGGPACMSESGPGMESPVHRQAIPQRAACRCPPPLAAGPLTAHGALAVHPSCAGGDRFCPVVCRSPGRARPV